ncbi:MAG: CBS domain-containing protein [Desulfobacteraceae bacterium]
MTDLFVKDMMIPLADYATVSENASMFDAVTALEKAQEEHEELHYRHRAVLVYNDQGRIVGKISQLDLLKGLEPKYKEIDMSRQLSRYGYSIDYCRSIFKQNDLWNKPLNDICAKAASLKVKTFMHTPTNGEYLDEKKGLDEAIHQLVMGQHHSLLVTKDDEIVGILRLTDVFNRVSETIKKCKI